MNTLKLTAVVLIGTMLISCAGRSPAPVAMTQAQDTTASCTAMRAELASNNEKIKELRSDENAKVGQNVGAVVGAVFFFPMLLAMDFQGAAKTDRYALEERNLYLAKLANERCQNGA
jgi:hypothetical protein